MGEPEREREGAPAPPADDPLEAVITLAEAARRCGLAAHTLTLQAERGRLRARKMGHTWITTRYWLEAYLAARTPGGSRARTAPRPVPAATDPADASEPEPTAGGPGRLRPQPRPGRAGRPRRGAPWPSAWGSR